MDDGPYFHRQARELSGRNGLCATAGFQDGGFRGCKPGGFSGFGSHRKSLVMVPKCSGGARILQCFASLERLFQRLDRGAMKSGEIGIGGMDSWHGRM
jgi:hypothetical protein